MDTILNTLFCQVTVCLVLLLTAAPELYAIQALVHGIIKLLKRIGIRTPPPFDDLIIHQEAGSRTRYVIAKTLAVAWYFWGSLFYVLWMGVAVFQVYKIETSMAWRPESESKRSVGQWSPRMAVGLAIGAAISLRVACGSQ
jgi:hypothetical protein